MCAAEDNWQPPPSAASAARSISTDARGLRAQGYAIFFRLPGAAFQCNRALPGGGNHFSNRQRFEHQAGKFFDAQSLQPGGGEEGGVGFAGGDFFQARVQVAAHFRPFHVGPPRPRLRPAARAAGGDAARNFNVRAAHEHVARVGARQKSGERQARRAGWWAGPWRCGRRDGRGLPATPPPIRA